MLESGLLLGGRLPLPLGLVNKEGEGDANALLLLELKRLSDGVMAPLGLITSDGVVLTYPLALPNE